MIAVAFLLVLVGLTVGLSLFGGGGGSLPVAEMLLLVGLFLAFFGAGIYVGAALGVLGLIAGFAFSDRPVLGLPRPDGLEPVLELRARRGAAVPADGRDPAARRPLRPPLQRAQRLARPAAGRAAAHQHRGLGRVLGDLGLLGRDGGDHGLGRAALLQGHALRPAHGARLARGGRRARQPHPARHHLHHLRADHRDLGRRALHRGGRPEHPGDGAVRARHPRQGGLGGARSTAPLPRLPLAAKLRSLARPGPDRDPDPPRARHDLWRARDADGVGGARRRRRHDLRRARGQAHLPHAQRLGRGDGAQHGADRAHPVRRLCAELRADQPRRAAGARQDSSPGCRCRPGRSCCSSSASISRSAPSWKASP